MLWSGIMYYKMTNIKAILNDCFGRAQLFQCFLSLLFCVSRWRDPQTTATLTIIPPMKRFLRMKCRVGTWTSNGALYAPWVCSNSVWSTNLSQHFSSPTCLLLLQGSCDHETNRISLYAETKDSLTEICCCGGVGGTAEEETRKNEIVALLWCQSV